MFAVVTPHQVCAFARARSALSVTKIMVARILDTMSPKARDVLRSALSLPKKDRARLAAELIASFDGPPDPDVDAAWAVEIERRCRRVISGESKGEDAEVVLARLERKLRRR